MLVTAPEWDSIFSYVRKFMFNGTWTTRLANEYYKVSNRASVYSLRLPTLYLRILNACKHLVYFFMDIQIATVRRTYT